MSPGASVTVSAYEGEVMGPGDPLTLEIEVPALRPGSVSGFIYLVINKE